MKIWCQFFIKIFKTEPDSDKFVYVLECDDSQGNVLSENDWEGICFISEATLLHRSVWLWNIDRQTQRTLTTEN